MPFNISEINKTDPSGILTIVFSDEDFTDTSQLTELKQALQRFEKVKFKLESITVKTKLAFIGFTTGFLQSANQLIEFDMSDNDLLCENDSRVSASTRGRGRGRRGGTGRGFREIRTVHDLKNMGDLLRSLFSVFGLQTVNLSHTYLDLKKYSAVIFPYILKVSRQYKHIDLRDIHRNGECFSLKQLYFLVKPDLGDQKPICQILVSCRELPQCLQEQHPSSEYINLADMTETIISAQRKALFQKKIDLITTSPSANGFVHIEFEPPLERLSDEETQVLAKALEVDGCEVSWLTLLPCNLTYLTPVIKNHPSLIQIDFSKLDVTSEVLASLNEIVATNSKLQRIKCNYQLFLQADFQQVIKSIKDNDQSGLKRVGQYEYKYIELIFSSEKSRPTPKALLALIEAVKKYFSDELCNIPIVIDLSMLEGDLERHLASKGLVHFPECVSYSDLEEKEKRSKPLLKIGQKTKFILSPCYDTHSRVMEIMCLYLQEQLKEQAVQINYDDEEEEHVSVNSDDDVKKLTSAHYEIHTPIETVILETKKQEKEEKEFLEGGNNSSVFSTPTKVSEPKLLPLGTQKNKLIHLQKESESQEENLKQQLKAYIDRVESRKIKEGKNKGEINYAYNFCCFFRESRSLNRRANCELAKQLRSELQKGANISSIFSKKKLQIQRSNLTDDKSEKKLNQLPGYVERGINSEELNTIIETALEKRK